MAALLPNLDKTKLVAENLNKRSTFYWPQARQKFRSTALPGYDRKLLGGFLSEDGQMQVERLLKIAFSLFHGLSYRVDTESGTYHGVASIVFLYDLRLHISQFQSQATTTH